MSLNDVSSLQAQQAVQQSSDQELKNLQAQVGALKKAPLDKRAAEEKKLKEACEGFESIFIKQLWKEMRATVPKEDILHSREEEQWKDMLDDEMSKKMSSDGGGIGLKDVLFSQLKDRLTRASKASAGAPVAAEPVRPLRNPDGIALKKTALAPLPGRDGLPLAPVGQAAEAAAPIQRTAEGGDVHSRVNALASRIELEWGKGGGVQAAEAAGPAQVGSGASAPAGAGASQGESRDGAALLGQAARQGDGRDGAAPGAQAGIQADVQAGVQAGSPAGGVQAGVRGGVQAASRTEPQAGAQAAIRTGAPSASNAETPPVTRNGALAANNAGPRAGASAAAPSGVQVAAAMSRPAQANQTIQPVQPARAGQVAQVAASGQTAQAPRQPAAPAEAPVPELKPSAKDLETLSRLGQELLRGNLLGAASLGRGSEEG